jgi:hypothetical protein
MAKRKKRKPQRRMTISVSESMGRKIETLARQQGKAGAEVVRDTLRFLGVKPGELIRAPVIPQKLALVGTAALGASGGELDGREVPQLPLPEGF